jgi:maleylpyruvate isomerase
MTNQNLNAQVVESFIQDSAGKFALGDEVTLADIVIIPQLYNARRFGVDLSPYPTILRIEAACAELAPFKQAHPDNQPDKE